MVTVVDLDPGQARTRQVGDHLVRQADATGAGKGVSQHGHSPGLGDQLHGALRRQCVVRHVIARVVVQPLVECRIAVDHDTPSDERVREVGAANGRARRHLSEHIGIADRYAVRSHEVDHPLDPGEAGGAHVLEFGMQGGARVEEVTQQVHALAAVAAGQLDAADQCETGQLRERLLRLSPSSNRVVVGQGDHIETYFGGLGQQPGRGLGPIADVRVRVQVNPHTRSVVVS